MLEVAGIEKLIRKGDGIIYYCTVDELYPLIKSPFWSWSWRFTQKELKRQFANVSREIIRIFIQMCEQCVLKKNHS